ncbi:HNH endonuclease [Geomonas sp. Red69]|nr:HNH endonuclease [Geomonas diazotrophica]
MHENQSCFQDYAKQRSAGHCELCGMKAPFNHPDGSPYLEAHFIVPFTDGGTDTLENCVALCPNCHRKLHVCPTKDDIQKLQRIATRRD